MRKPVYFLAALALLAAAGCSRGDGIVAPERRVAPPVNDGSTTSTTTTTNTSPAQDTVSKGGWLGSGG